MKFSSSISTCLFSMFISLIYPEYSNASIKNDWNQNKYCYQIPFNGQIVHIPYLSKIGKLNLDNWKSGFTTHDTKSFKNVPKTSLKNLTTVECNIDLISAPTALQSLGDIYAFNFGDKNISFVSGDLCNDSSRKVHFIVPDYIMVDSNGNPIGEPKYITLEYYEGFDEEISNKVLPDKIYDEIITIREHYSIKELKHTVWVEDFIHQHTSPYAEDYSAPRRMMLSLSKIVEIECGYSPTTHQIDVISELIALKKEEGKLKPYSMRLNKRVYVGESNQNGYMNLLVNFFSKKNLYTEDLYNLIYQKKKSKLEKEALSAKLLARSQRQAVNDFFGTDMGAMLGFVGSVLALQAVNQATHEASGAPPRKTKRYRSLFGLPCQPTDDRDHTCIQW